MKVFAFLFLTLCVQVPMQFYISYQILKRVNASELMWGFFFTLIPVAILTGILSHLMKED